MKQLKNLLCILLVTLMLSSAVCMSVSANDNSVESTTVDTSETNGSPQPDCDSKPVEQETSDTTVTTDSEEPDCDSKPVVIPTSDPTETTEEPSVPLTGPDGTAPTDPSVTTDPTETTTFPSETAPTASQETTLPTESSTQTDPTESETQPAETQPTETEDTTATESTETTQPDTTPKLNKKKLELKSGEIFNLKVKHSKGARVRYSSDNIESVIVSSDGKVTALKKGTANITVRLNDKKFTCKVTVTNNPKLKKAGKTITEIKVSKGKKVKVNLVGKAETINNIYYNTPIAKITSKPPATTLKIKGLKVGTTIVKVKANNSKTIKLKVIVK